MAIRIRNVSKLVLASAFVIAVAIGGRAAKVTMPYRVLETDYYGWSRVLYGSLGIAAGCVAIWMIVSSSRVQRTGGLCAGLVVFFLFVFGGPSGPHSIISVKNICINQLRQIDGAKEHWAELNSKRVGDEVDLAAVGELLRSKKLPECPEGGRYWIGKVGEVPRCRIAEHNLK